jgi:hypothetical protein
MAGNALIDTGAILALLKMPIALPIKNAFPR